MATSGQNLTVGAGFLTDAYGKHVVGGTLVESRVDTDSAGEKRVHVHVLLGRGEWNALNQLTYAGTIIDPSNYTFYPGNMSPAQDSRFPNSLRHGRVARYTATLPKGISEDFNPSSLKAICECKKVTLYNNDGSVENASFFSLSPANHFVDLIKQNCLALGLALNDHVDWPAYHAARTYYNTTIPQPDYGKVPKNFTTSILGSGGSLAAGTYAFSVQAAGADPDTDYSLRAGEITVPVTGAEAVRLSWDAVAGAVQYRVWVRNTSGTYNFVDTSSTTIDIASLGSSGTPPTGAGGTYLINRARFESHVFFNQPTSLESALNAVLWQCASDYQRDGKKYRILTPESREPVFSLSPANTMPNSFKFWRVARDQRPNRVTVKLRDITSDVLELVESVPVNRELSQAKVGVVEETVTLFSGTRNQGYRIANWRIRVMHDLSLRASVTEDGTGKKLLPGDVVEFTDEHANWTDKEFVVVERTIDNSDSAGNVSLELWEYDGAAYSDNDSAPLQSTQPVKIPDKFLAPPAISNLAFAVTLTVNLDGSVTVNLDGDIEFAGFTGAGRQRGLVYHKPPGASEFVYIAAVDPNPTTGHGGFRVTNPAEGEHLFQVITVSGVGIQQTDAVVDWDYEVDYGDIPGAEVPPLDAFSISQTQRVKPDGTILYGLLVNATFGEYAGSQRAVIELHRPQDEEDVFVEWTTLIPNPETGTASYQIEGLELGLHEARATVYGGAGILQTGSPSTDTETIEAYDALPAAPSVGGDIVRDNDSIKWTWEAPEDAPEVAYFEITDVDNNVIARVDSNTWHEPVPDTSTVVRRVYAVDSMGNRSNTFAALEYNADYQDNRVVFNTPVGSGNFIPNGFSLAAVTEALNFASVQGGDWDTEFGLYTKTLSSSWLAANSGGVLLNRALAWGDGLFEFRIPYAIDAEAAITVGLIFDPNITQSGALPSSREGMQWGIIADTEFYVATRGFTIWENGVDVDTIEAAWQEGDIVRIEVAAGEIKYYWNDTLLYTSLVSAKYPMYPGAYAFESGLEIEATDFQITGVLQDTLARKPRWRKQSNVLLNNVDNLIPTGSLPAGASSIESFEGSCYLSFFFINPAGGSDQGFASGFSRLDPDQDEDTIERAILVGSSDIVGESNQGFKVIESGVEKFAFDSAGLGATDHFRIVLDYESLEVRYLLNGGVVYTSDDPLTPGRYFVDFAFVGTDSDVTSKLQRCGAVGAKGKGWRINPDGLAELARGVKVADVEIDEATARSTGAIRPDRRYRGNDFGPPLESRLDYTMFRLGNTRALENDVYDELFIDIPESILNDPYANFDSVDLIRVKVFDIMGNVVTEVDQAFSGRGKCVIGVHTREYADPIDMAVYAIQLRNVYGFSRPVFWTFATSTLNPFSDFKWDTNFSWNGNGTTQGPTWANIVNRTMNANASPINDKSVTLSWTPPANTPATQSVFYRVHTKGKNRTAWIVHPSNPISASATTVTIANLSPNTEYEVMVRGTASAWGNPVYVRTFQPPTAAPARLAPSGLTVTALSTTSVRLNWVRNATDNTNTELFINGSSDGNKGQVITTDKTSLTAGATYRFKIRNIWGGAPTESDFSNEVEIVMPTNPLPTNNDPTSLTALLIGNGSTVSLSWNRNGGSQGTVERSYDGVNYDVIASGLGTTTSYIDSTPGANVHVWYRVFNATGGSNYSNVVDLWTQGNTLPDLPDNPLPIN